MISAGTADFFLVIGVGVDFVAGFAAGLSAACSAASVAGLAAAFGATVAAAFATVFAAAFGATVAADFAGGFVVFFAGVMVSVSSTTPMDQPRDRADEFRNVDAVATPDRSLQRCQ